MVTPTASGKTLCYNLPVLCRLMADPEARALYLFPTKALAEDQLHEFHATVERDGRADPGLHLRRRHAAGRAQAIRERANVVLTNPDMLHAGILPHHTKWAKLFENLRYVVIDELHSYRGVYGSHLANVLRRLKRICEFYGSQAAVHLLLGDHRQPQGAGRERWRARSSTWWSATARPRARSTSSSTIRRW